MRIVVKKYASLPLNVVKFHVKRRAIERVHYYTFSHNEVILDQYFRNKKTSLRQVCLQLIKNAKIVSTKEQDYLAISFLDEEDNNLANLITFGSLDLPKSDILKFAFGKD